MLLAAIAAADPILQAPDLQTTAQPGVTQATPAVAGQPSSLPSPQAANDDDADTAFEPAADSQTKPVQAPLLDPGAITAPKSGTKPDKKANADKTEAEADVAPATVQNLPPDPGAITAPKSGTKPDKKANAEKAETDIAAASPPAEPQIPVLLQPPIVPMAQATVQTQAVASESDNSDPILGVTASSAAGDTLPASSRAVPAPPPVSNAPQPVAPEPLQAGAKQAAAPSQPLIAANDDSTDDSADDSDLLNNIAPTDQAKPAAHAAEIKFTQVRNPGSKSVSQAASQPQVLAAADEDVDMAAEPSSAQASAGPQATTQPQGNLADTAQTSLAPPAPQKPGAADKPAPGKIADLLSPGTNSVAASTNDSVQSPNATPSMTADSDSDSKPAHVAASAAPQAQPDAPQQPAHVAAAALPQPTLAINPAGTNAAGGLSLSVHVASHDTGSQSSTPSDVTPDTDALAISVAARSLGGAKQFDIRLDPPELGRVEVRLSIDASGKTQAHMTADQPQTLELLQKDATNLTRALRDAGLDVSQNGLNFSLKGQGQNNGGQSGNFGNASRGLSLPAIAQSIETAQPVNIPYSLLGNARLDIHV